MKRLMCVPLKSWGRSAYRLMVATVDWVRFFLSRTTIGYCTFLTPTFWMSMRRWSFWF